MTLYLRFLIAFDGYLPIVGLPNKMVRGNTSFFLK